MNNGFFETLFNSDLGGSMGTQETGVLTIMLAFVIGHFIVGKHEMSFTLGRPTYMILSAHAPSRSRLWRGRTLRGVCGKNGVN